MKELSNLSTYSKFPSAVRNSPVEISKKATPALFLSICKAAKKLFSPTLSTDSLVETPGVTNSVTPRFTNFLVLLGSSN